MGQIPDKCNCFYKKVGNYDYIFNENIMNFRGYSNSAITFKTKQPNSQSCTRPIEKFQGLVRGVQFRAVFSQLRLKLEEEAMKHIKELSKRFTTPTLQKIEANPRFGYDSDGWKHRFGIDDKSLKVEYGKTFISNLLIKEKGSVIYSGQTNIDCQRHGFGVSLNSEGEKYEGYWYKDEFTGWGKHVDKEGNVLIGKHQY